MKPLMHWTLLAVASAFALSMNDAGSTNEHGGNGYECSWYTVNGGGAMFSAGGNFELNGTIGQPDTGVSTGGRYTFAAGFWAVVQVVQVAGFPQLKIVKQGQDSAVLSWEDADDSFTLQESGTLRAADWLASVRVATADGSARSVILADINSRIFFRLAKKGPVE